MSEKEDLNISWEDENNSLEWEQTWLVIPSSIVYEWDSNRNIRTEMETCYLDYAMSVIVSRALPDIRDGFKPVQKNTFFYAWAMIKS